MTFSNFTNFSSFSYNSHKSQLTRLEGPSIGSLHMPLLKAALICFTMNCGDSFTIWNMSKLLGVRIIWYFSLAHLMKSILVEHWDDQWQLLCYGNLTKNFKNLIVTVGLEWHCKLSITLSWLVSSLPNLWYVTIPLSPP